MPPSRTSALEAIAGHRAEVIRALVRRFGSRELAEDAVQDALLVAARTGASPASPGAWLHVVAHRRAIDAIRSRHAEPPTTVAGCASDPVEELLRSEGVREVLGELSALPARQRRALELAALEGRSPAEIGADLSIHESAAKALVCRARGTLRARLAERALTCAEVRELVRDAAERGVRSPHRVQRHLRACAACGALRPRRVRLGLWAILTARWWPTAAESTLTSLGVKGCASVCAVALAGTAPPVMAPALPTAEAREEQPSRPLLRTPPVPVVVAAAAPKKQPRARTVTKSRVEAPRPSAADSSAGRADKNLARALAACYETNSQRCRHEAEDTARAAGISREDLWASRRAAADRAGLSPVARAKQAARDQRRAHKDREPVTAEPAPTDAASPAPPLAVAAPAADPPPAAATSTPPDTEAPTTPASPTPPAVDPAPPTDRALPATATPFTGADPLPKPAHGGVDVPASHGEQTRDPCAKCDETFA